MLDMHVQPWEQPLLTLASEANDLPAGAHYASRVAPEVLGQADAYCAALTSEHSRSFYLASGLLPIGKREAARALYAFCRVTDDIVDRPSGNVAASLAQWRQRVFTNHPPPEDLVAVAWTEARARYHIPHRFVEQLVDGVARDLHQTRYETFADLASYAYGVASTVGLMSMHIIGYSGPEAIRYAVKLGVALQLTNILRDVGEDWRRGRLYLPLTELAQFGLTEADIAGRRIDERWRAFMQFQIARNRSLYDEAWPGIALLAPDGRFAISAASKFYLAILDDIEAHDYNVFDRRAYVGRWGKLRLLPAIWLRSRTVAAPASRIRTAFGLGA